jgi:transcription antitermination factor NusG
MKNGLIYRGAQAAYFLVTKLPRRFGFVSSEFLEFCVSPDGVEKKDIEHLRFIYGNSG